jgi:hypothetical protein
MKVQRTEIFIYPEKYYGNSYLRILRCSAPLKRLWNYLFYKYFGALHLINIMLICAYKGFGALHLHSDCEIIFSTKVSVLCTSICYGNTVLYWQIQGEMWVTGAVHSYFISYDPRILGKERLHFVKIDRDENAIEQLETIIPQAISVRDMFLKELRKGGIL